MKYKVGILLLAALILAGCSPKEKTESPLLCHVGGTMRPVFEKLTKAYEAETGKKVEINSAGSGELLANIEMQAEGDLYVSHDPFLDIIMSKGLAVNGWTLGEIYPVIIVQKGNPKNIQTLNDLARDDVELALTDYKLSTLGRLLPTIFRTAGMSLNALTQQKNIVIHRSGSYVANLVAMKSADAALVWEAVAVLRRDKLDSIPITENLPVPYVDAVTSATGKSYKLTPVRVTICSLKCSKQLEAVDKFMRFVSSFRAKRILEEYGFGVSADLRKQEYKEGKRVNL
ncbi:Putative binding protein [Pontiella desulfatans]|uniref:Binding protein n=1 Tax=Pontiella desulfatans TaxID=2750659 RepID=A0A6C2U5J4_PONDE|nr:substrate-binding domain-containing protein [Pontiella desulfatans]VGO15077.1 Putative binding protein [Pontiella desulfatans]